MCYGFFILLFTIPSHIILVSASTSNRAVVFVKTESSVENNTSNYIKPAGNSRFHDSSVYASGAGCDVEQVHITLGNDENTILVSYATTSLETVKTYVYYSTNKEELIGNPNFNSKSLQVAIGSSKCYSSQVSISTSLIHPAMGSPQAKKESIINLEDTSKWAFDPITKEKYGNWAEVSDVIYGPMAYNNPKSIYDSPLLHTAVLDDLVPGRTYYYRPKGSCHIFSFKAPSHREPTSSLMDVHLFPSNENTNLDEPSQITSNNVNHNEDEDDKYENKGYVTNNSPYPFKIGLLADLGQTRVSEASLAAIAALAPDVALLAGDLSYADGWPQLWDSFGRLLQPVFGEIPLLTTGGNHEMQSNEGWQHYEARYPTPHTASDSAAVGYWAREVGPVHIIALNSYAQTSNSSRQFHWLSTHLSTKINRHRTPWLVVFMHVPWYCSSAGHWREAELMRQDMEGLLYDHGVDAVIAGHIHAYERTHPVYQRRRDACGPVHFVVGDSGNYENVLLPWRSPQDDWSAFREGSFGVAGISFVNTSHAHFAWHRHACDSNRTTEHFTFDDSCVSPGDNSEQKMYTSDEVWIVRPSLKNCRNRHRNTVTVYSGAQTANPAVRKNLRR